MTRKKARRRNRPSNTAKRRASRGEAVMCGTRNPDCSSNKRTWTVRKDAKDFAKKVSAKVGSKLTVYRCTECGLFHTTSRKSKNKLELDLKA